MKIEIDGKEIETEPGKMIIQVADQHSIHIPRFCYHNKLSVAANCRMCLVHVDKAPKPLPACATPVMEGMKVWTNDEMAKQAQHSVMEFLLINHPLDCPICDQGGECELQDVSMQYGADSSRYDGTKRSVVDENLGSLIATDMTRCIQCTRCVRFGTEIAGERELGATGRGELMRIETFVAQHVNSEVSGNIIDLCPVGALVSKPFLYKARSWELEEYPFVAPHDCLGSNINLHVRRNELLRVVPRKSEQINEIWLADRDRFSYESIYHEDRLRKPMINRNGKWQTVSWIEAMKFAIAGINLALESFGADHFGTLATPSATLEEYYLLQQFTRGLGSPNIDHRLRVQDFSDQDLAPLFPNFGTTIEEIEHQDAVLLIGSNVHKELPNIGLKLRKLVKRGGVVCAINPVAFHYNFELAAHEVVAAGNMLQSIAAIAKEVLRMSKQSPAAEMQLLESIKPTPAEQQIAAKMFATRKSLILLGPHVQMHPHAAAIRAWANLIAKVINCKVGDFTEGANSSGAWIAGCVPHRMPANNQAKMLGKNAIEMLQKPLRAYLLFGIEPEFDSILGDAALQTLQNAEFVVSIAAYQSDSLLDISDVILPMAVYAENTGTLINAGGTWQTQQAALTPIGESRQAWKILRVLGNLAGIADFDYHDPAQIKDKLYQELLSSNQETALTQLGSWQYRAPAKASVDPIKALQRIAPISLYAIDSLTRRSTALQKTQDAMRNATIEVNHETAKHIGVAHGDIVQVSSLSGRTSLEVQINSRVPEFSAMIVQAHAETNCLGLPYGIVEVKP